MRRSILRGSGINGKLLAVRQRHSFGVKLQAESEELEELTLPTTPLFLRQLHTNL